MNRKLWRISDYSDLSGTGGRYASGRWHTMSKPIVYTAETPAGAFTELLVQMDPLFADEDFQLLEIEAPLSIAVKSTRQLPLDWIERTDVTRAIGDEWLANMSSALLRVPSAIVPETYNILLNPMHRDAAKIRIVKKRKLRVDPRLR